MMKYTWETREIAHLETGNYEKFLNLLTIMGYVNEMDLWPEKGRNNFCIVVGWKNNFSSLKREFSLTPNQQVLQP